jgi:hypothetical protein
MGAKGGWHVSEPHDGKRMGTRVGRFFALTLLPAAQPIEWVPAPRD